MDRFLSCLKWGGIVVAGATLIALVMLAYGILAP